MDKHLLLVMTRTDQGNFCTTDKLETEVRNLASESQGLVTQLASQNETLAATRQDLRTQQMKLCIVERNVSEQKNELTKVREKLNASNGKDALHETQVTAQLEECMNFLRATEGRIRNLERELGQLKAATLQQHGSRSLSHSASSISVERRLDKNEHQVAVCDIQLADHGLKLQILEATSYDGQFIWRLTTGRGATTKRSAVKQLHCTALRSMSADLDIRSVPVYTPTGTEWAKKVTYRCFLWS